MYSCEGFHVVGIKRRKKKRNAEQPITDPQFTGSLAAYDTADEALECAKHLAQCYPGKRYAIVEVSQVNVAVMRPKPLAAKRRKRA